MPAEKVKKCTSNEELHNGNFISLCVRDGWFEYIHEKRCGGHIVAVLIFDRNESTGHRVLGRWEHNPAYRPGMSLLSLTGGVEPERTPEQMAVLEASEEAGVDIEELDLIKLGDVHPYKAADTVVTLFAYDGHGLYPELTEGDGSEGERGAYCEWIPAKRAAACEDPLVATMITRLRLYTGIDLLA
jgi:8-oxo-dGTP pyrophosphatase MutT (NUDIX family)